MASNKLRILVMRDSEKVRSLHLSPVWLTLLVWAFIILACLAALGGTASWWLYQKYIQFQESDQEKDRHIVELRYQLERCQNMEKIVSGGMAPLAPALADEPVPAAPAAPAPAPVEPAPLPPRPEAQQPVTARISNITVRPRSDSQIRLSFDISNAGEGSVLTGRVLVAVQTGDGAFTEVFPPRDELAFQIARFKRIATVFSLPENVSMNDIKAVRIQVRFSNGTTLPAQTFPFPTPAAS